MSRLSGRRQRGVVEVQTVKNLIVVVAGRGLRAVGKLLRIGALKEEDRRIRRSEFRVQARIVERVVLVRQYLYRRSPWPSRRVGFGIPEFAKCGRFAKLLHKHGHPAVAIFIPVSYTHLTLPTSD